MQLSGYVDEIKFLLTGGVLELEVSDSELEKCVMRGLKDLSRYYDSTKSFVVKAASCIDLSEHPDVLNVVSIYRGTASGNLDSTSVTSSTSYSDPNSFSMWSMSGGAGYYQPNFASRYVLYQTMQSLNNSLTTDLAFKFDVKNQKLYINAGSNLSGNITVEYIPRLTDPEDLVTPYWENILLQLSLCYAKIIVGRIRTRYKPSGAQWEQDGQTLLDEGANDLKELLTSLREQAQYFYPID